MNMKKSLYAALTAVIVAGNFVSDSQAKGPTFPNQNPVVQPQVQAQQEVAQGRSFMGSVQSRAHETKESAKSRAHSTKQWMKTHKGYVVSGFLTAAGAVYFGTLIYRAWSQGNPEEVRSVVQKIKDVAGKDWKNAVQACFDIAGGIKSGLGSAYGSASGFLSGVRERLPNMPSWKATK